MLPRLYFNRIRLQLLNHRPTAKVQTMVRLHSNGGPGREEIEPWGLCVFILISNRRKNVLLLCEIELKPDQFMLLYLTLFRRDKLVSDNQRKTM